MSAPAWPADVFAALRGWSALSASGPDAGRFLQAFATNDVSRLAVGQSCEAMFTDAKARVQAYAWVARVDDQRYAVLLGSPRAAELLAHLDRYLIGEQVELADTSATGVVLTAPGAPTPAALAGAEAAPITALGVTACWCDLKRATAAAAELAAAGLRRETDDGFRAWRIRSGVPLDGADVDARNLPQEVDRNEQAISFTKGCYLGQEPVARIDALGHVNWLLRGLSLTVAPGVEAGAEVRSGDAVVGRVTSVAVDGDQAVALAYLRRGHAVPGAQVRVGDAVGRVASFPIAREAER